MSWNDPGDPRPEVLSITEALLAAEAELREIKEANRSGVLHEITEHAARLAKLAEHIRARSIFLHFQKPMQLLPAHLEEEAE